MPELLKVDYSKIERRILNSMQHPEADPHTLTAAELFRVPVERVTRDMRSVAKEYNHRKAWSA